jgi:Raf kinase inhibitor-like YbhB/YbcL family protein
MRLVQSVSVFVLLCGLTAMATNGAPAVAEQAGPAKMTVSSSVLKEGQPIPKDYTADGKNVSPPISWSGLPAGTKELALICEDPIAPTPQPFVHWVVYKIPATAKGLPEGMPIDDTTQMPADLAGTIQGLSGFRRPIWRGPAPPKPGVTHQYHFIVYALDAPLDVQPGLNKTQLLEAMKGHIIGQGELVATYTR